MNSMTGYAAVQKKVGNGRISVEIKTLNSRYLECKFKSSSIYNFLEPKVLELVKGIIVRGYVEISLYGEDLETSPKNFPNLNAERLKHYIKELNAMQKSLHLKESLTLQDLLSLPNVWTGSSEKKSSQNHWKMVQPILKECLDKVTLVREKEGKILKQDILNYSKKLDHCAQLWINEKDRIIQDSQNKLKERVSQLLQDKAVDESRLLQEVALACDRSDISEELVRFESHCKNLRNMVNQKGSIGKNLDFLIQEMMREVNTIGSKVRDSKMSQTVIECKSVIEKMREQVQNVE